MTIRLQGRHPCHAWLAPRQRDRESNLRGAEDGDTSRQAPRQNRPRLARRKTSLYLGSNSNRKLSLTTALALGEPIAARLAVACAAAAAAASGFP